MDHWGNWIAWSIPLYFAATGGLQGKAKGRALWAYFWLLAGFLGLSSWHLYATWHAPAPPDYQPLPLMAALYARTLWANGVLTVVLLVLPVVWYCHDRRKEQVAGQVSQTV